MLSTILEKLQETVENPGLYKPLTAEEQAELFLTLFAPKAKRKVKVVRGIDGVTPEKDRDYLSKESTEKLVAELASKTKAELEALVATKLANVANGRDGKDAVITPELIARVADLAQSMIVLPDFPTLITMEPEAIRNSLELLQGEERLSMDAIDGLSEALKDTNKKILTGGLTRGGVLQLIAENSTGSLPAGGNTGQVLAKASDADGDAEWVSPTAGAAAWGDITGTLSAQTDLQTALNGKAATSHTHAISDVTGLQTALDGKAASLGVDDNYVTDAEKTKLANLSGTNTGDQTSIVGITGTKAQFDTAVTDGNFMYVGDAPTSHTHVIADTTGLQTALDGKASSTHSHVISDVTGLQTALDGKAASLGADDNYVTDAEKVKLSNLSGTNTGDQTSIVGITGTKAQFNTAVTDGDILYTDAIGSTVQGYSAVLAATTASFTTADETKLDGIETAADVTDATNVAAAGAIMDGDFTTNGLMKRTGAGTYATAVAGTDYVAPDTQLTDLAALSYTGNGLKFIRVNTGETGLELATVAGGGDVTGDDTSTTAQNIVAYTGTGGKNITELTGTQGDVLYHNGTSWVKLAKGAFGQQLQMNSGATAPEWAYGATIHYSISSGATTTAANTTPVSVSGAVFTYATNAVYRIWVMGRLNSTAATTGAALQFDLSSAVTAIDVQGFHTLAATGTTTGFSSIADDTSQSVSSGVPTGPLDVPIQANALLVTGANTGTCQLRLRSETTAVTELLAGTVMIVERVA